MRLQWPFVSAKIDLLTMPSPSQSELSICGVQSGPCFLSHERDQHLTPYSLMWMPLTAWSAHQSRIVHEQKPNRPCPTVRIRGMEGKQLPGYNNQASLGQL